MSRRILAVAAAFVAAVTATAVMAQADVVKQREALMKELGSATRPVSGMLRGSVPFDLATVQAALDTYAGNAGKLGALFPEGSGAGSDSLPSVWERKAEFDGLMVKFGTDARAARAAITDEASFKANFPGVIRSCGTCHDSFRQKS